MILITREYMAKRALEKYNSQYPVGRNYTHCRFDVEESRKKLEGIGSSPTPEQIVEILNDSWVTPPKCYECESENIPVVMLGEAPDYESCTTWICENCAIKARAIFGGSK